MLKPKNRKEKYKIRLKSKPIKKRKNKVLSTEPKS